MFRRLSCEVVPLTRALAEMFAEMPPAPNDRSLKEWRVEEYRQEVAAGRFRPPEWASANCLETGLTYRVNGKHTSVLFTRLESIPPGLEVVVGSYECPTLLDVADLYSSFDSRSQGRTVGEINCLYAAAVPELTRLPRRLIDACAAAIQLHAANGMLRASQSVSRSVRGQELVREAPFVLWVASVITDTSKYKYLTRAGVIAAMLATYRKSQRDATSFWEAVRDETGNTPDAPDRQLARWLALTTVHAGTGPTVKSRRADAREFYVRSVHCWNAWRRKDSLKILKYHADAKLPAVA